MQASDIPHILAANANSFTHRFINASFKNKMPSLPRYNSYTSLGTDGRHWSIISDRTQHMLQNTNSAILS